MITSHPTTDRWYLHVRQSGLRDYSNALELVTKQPDQETFVYQPIDLGERYIDNVKLKIDNPERKYIINTFYYKRTGQYRGFVHLFLEQGRSEDRERRFSEFDDLLRQRGQAKGPVALRFR